MKRPTARARLVTSHREIRTGVLPVTRAVILLLRSALVSSPMRTRALLRSRWRSLVSAGLVLAGLVVQVVLVHLMYELVDLTLSLMEVWAELARKHLELTL